MLPPVSHGAVLSDRLSDDSKGERLDAGHMWLSLWRLAIAAPQKSLFPRPSPQGTPRRLRDTPTVQLNIGAHSSARRSRCRGPCKNAQVPLRVYNNFVRWVDIYVQYLDARGQNLSINPSPTGQDTKYSQHLALMPQVCTVLGAALITGCLTIGVDVFALATDIQITVAYKTIRSIIKENTGKVITEMTNAILVSEANTALKLTIAEQVGGAAVAGAATYTQLRDNHFSTDNIWNVILGVATALPKLLFTPHALDKILDIAIASPATKRTRPSRRRYLSSARCSPRSPWPATSRPGGDQPGDGAVALGHRE